MDFATSYSSWASVVGDLDKKSSRTLRWLYRAMRKRKISFYVLLSASLREFGIHVDTLSCLMIADSNNYPIKS